MTQQLLRLAVKEWDLSAQVKSRNFWAWTFRFIVPKTTKVAAGWKPTAKDRTSILKNGQARRNHCIFQINSTPMCREFFFKKIAERVEDFWFVAYAQTFTPSLYLRIIFRLTGQTRSWNRYKCGYSLSKNILRGAYFFQFSQQTKSYPVPASCCEFFVAVFC